MPEETSVKYAPTSPTEVSVILFGIVYKALLDTGAVSTFIGQEVLAVLRQRNVAPVSAP